LQIAQNCGEPGPPTGAATFDGALGYAEHPCGVGHRVAVHVDRDYRGALLDGQVHQGPLHRDRRLDLRGSIRHGIDIVERDGGVDLVAAQPIQAGIDHDAVQPAADRGVVAKCAGAAMGRDHGLLQRVLGVLRVATGQPGDSVQVSMVAVKQLLEGVPVTGDMSSQQLCVAALFCHGRTLTNRR